jgi:hypothetical protein
MRREKVAFLPALLLLLTLGLGLGVTESFVGAGARAEERSDGGEGAPTPRTEPVTPPKKLSLRERRELERLETEWPGAFLGVRIGASSGMNGLPLAERSPELTGVFSTLHLAAESGVQLGLARGAWGVSLGLEYAPWVLLPTPFSTPGSALRVGADLLILPRSFFGATPGGAWRRWAFEVGFSPWAALRAVSEGGQGYVFQGVGYRAGVRYQWIRKPRWDIELFGAFRADRFPDVTSGFADSGKTYEVAEFAGKGEQATLTAVIVGLQFNFRRE